MDVKQLNYFVQIAKYGSYSLASQKLYISQPALSKVIKNMEEEMGFTFFYTYQRKQKLTDAGQAFYEKAVRLLDNYNDLIQTTYTEEGIDKGHLRIGLSVAGGGALFSHIVPGFNASYPQITFSIFEKETNLLKEELLKKNLDLAYIDLRHMNGAEDEENFESYSILKSENVLVASVDNPITQKHNVGYEDMHDQRLILYNAGKEIGSQTEMEMKKLGLAPNIVLVSTQWNFILDMVANNMGVVFCPYYIYNKFNGPGLTCVKLNEKIGYREIGIITKKNEYKTRACTCFLDYATDVGKYEHVMNKLIFNGNTPD